MPTDAEQPAQRPILDATQAAFILGPVIITAAARNHANVPSNCIALGRKLAADRKTLTILVSPQRSGHLVDDVRANGAIAAVFCEQTSHRTLQIKGSDAIVRGADDSDYAAYRHYVEALVPQFRAVGASEAYARTVLSFGDALVAIAFTPASAFVQTPGPRAGERAQGGDVPVAGR